LPFGYSEAPAEFQKRLFFILKDLLKSGKILLYIDNILIPTRTVDENLVIIKEVLTILKKYSLKLNWAKCLFLRKEIEFLGYSVSAGGIISEIYP